VDLDVLLERLRVGALWVFFLLSSGYLFYLAYQESLKYPPSPEYMSGLLAFEDLLKCGLVRTQQMDRLSCRFSATLCSDLKDYNQRKIRVLGNKVECGPGNDMVCSNKAEFDETSFYGDQCFEGFQLVKVFPAPKEE
jgi:hypothetical protein